MCFLLPLLVISLHILLVFCVLHNLLSFPSLPPHSLPHSPPPPPPPLILPLPPSLSSPSPHSPLTLSPHSPPPPHSLPLSSFSPSPSLPPPLILPSIHDRKISVLGLCAVMQCAMRPEAVLAMANEIVPAVLVQLDGLKDSYQSMSHCCIKTMTHSLQLCCVQLPNNTIDSLTKGSQLCCLGYHTHAFGNFLHATELHCVS